MPTEVIGSLLGHRQTVTTAQLLARLHRAGLVEHRQFNLGPLLGARPTRLWSLSTAGRVALDRRGPLAPKDSRLPYGEPERRPDPVRQKAIPLLVACYRLFAQVASGLERPVQVCAWESPWVRTTTSTGSRRMRRVRVPAAVVLRSGPPGVTPSRFLLLPDVGTTPVASFRPLLRALVDLRTAHIKDGDEPVLIVGVVTAPRLETARIEAWQSLLQDVASRTDDCPVRARIVGRGTWSNIRVHDRRPTRSDEVFAAVARLPLLTRAQLASLLRTSTRRIARLERELVECGWLRPAITDEAPARGRVGCLGLLELTEAGRHEAARRLLLPAGLARRHHGVISGDTSRRRFQRYLDHTHGTNAVFVGFALAARHVSKRGDDEALEDWRGAAACARGRFRPDGYGCYRREGARFGFFLEFDRGTEKPRDYARKLDLYYRHRNSTAATRAYAGFPSLLVVTTSMTAEARFAIQANLAEQRHGGTPLTIFLTTTRYIDTCPEGVLGPIWRSAADPWTAKPARMCWLPQLRRQ
jgi:hypothetical protein